MRPAAAPAPKPPAAPPPLPPSARAVPSPLGPPLPKDGGCGAVRDREPAAAGRVPSSRDLYELGMVIARPASWCQCACAPAGSRRCRLPLRRRVGTASTRTAVGLVRRTESSSGWRRWLRSDRWRRGQRGRWRRGRCRTSTWAAPPRSDALQRRSSAVAEEESAVLEATVVGEVEAGALAEEGGAAA